MTLTRTPFVRSLMSVTAIAMLTLVTPSVRAESDRPFGVGSRRACRPNLAARTMSPRAPTRAGWVRSIRPTDPRPS